MHKKIKNYFDKFFYVQQLSDKEIANFARKQKIDIAIHRNGHSQNSRSNIFAYRAAQLQISYLGYPGSTGLDYIDYMVADQVVIPPENQKYYSEKIIFMPDSYYPTDNTRRIGEKKFQRSDFNIPEDSFVFCCFNNSYKISFEEYDIWMKLLKEIENSYLCLLSHDKLDQKNLLFEAKKRNVDSSQIKFFDYINIEDHLARHALADLYLDTFNYNGHTSTVDALWAGVPVITKLGQSLTATGATKLKNTLSVSGKSYMQDSLSVEIERALDTLTEREADVIRLNYGLGGQQPLTLQEIGETFDLSRERVRQIREKGIRRLRHESKSKILKKYLG